MNIVKGIPSLILIITCFASFSSGIKCWICYQASSNRDCLIRGRVKQCNPYEGCENEVRYSGYGTLSITKRCKQLRACSNDQMQNSMISNNKYQCATNRHSSVCRCCCNTDNCNKAQLACLDKGKPKCRFLYLPSGASQCYGSSDGISLGTRCKLSCNSGYELIGSERVTCERRNGMAEWSEPIPKCRKLPTCVRILGKTLSNGFVRCTGRTGVATLGTSCVYRCNPRYFMVNANKRKTVANYERTVCTLEKSSLMATWSKKRPNCVEEMCPSVTNFENGVSTCSDFNKLGSICTFSCFRGYDLIGESTITCIRSFGVKNWDSRPPTCRAKPCPANTFTKALLTAECTDANRYGSICSVTCRKGYYMSDPKTNSAIDVYTPTCVLKEGGVVWSKGPPKCLPKKCQTHKPSENGAVKCTAGNQYQSRCTFSCTSLVHEISGEKTLTCIDDGRQGNQYGVWSAPRPTCVLKKCPRIDSDATNVKCTKGYQYKSSCTFSCKKGFFMVAEDNLTIVRSKAETKTTCSLIDRDVAWSHDPPKCEIKRCPEIKQVPDHGTMTCSGENRIDSKCHFTCDDGFEMAGKPTLQCRAGKRNEILGRWSARTPICKRRSCGQMYYTQATSNLTCTDGFNYESLCTMGCNNGYYMRSIATDEIIERVKTTCLFSEDLMTWSSRMPSCQPKSCSSIPGIANGDMKCSKELIYGAQCQFSCEKGFTLTGSRGITCENGGLISETGKWSSAPPTCEPKRCSALALDSTKMEVDCSRGNEYSSECKLSCKPMYFMRHSRTNAVIRSMVSRCNINDDEELYWGPKPLMCEPVTCQRIDDPVMYTSCSNGHQPGSRCTFSCPIGYDLVGNVTTKCMQIGQYNAEWKYPVPHCKVRTCTTLVSEEDLNMTCTENSDYKSVCSFICMQNRGLFMTSSIDNKIIKSGVVKLTCEINPRGKMYWTGGKLPKCHIKYCRVRRNPKNGRVKCSDKSKYQSTCKYTCSRRYKLFGSASATCEEGKPNFPQGKWSHEAPTCKR